MTDVRHIDSFYRAEYPEPVRRATLDGPVVADCAIVGGGLAGLTTARELLKAGKSVVLIESDRLGWAASGRNGGFVSPGYAEGISAAEKRLGKADARRLWALSVAGSDYVKTVLAETGREDLIAGRGAMEAWRYPDRADMLGYAEKMARDYDHHLRPVETEEMRSLLVTRRYHHGLMKENSIQINPLAYAEVLGVDVEARGGRIFEATPGLAVERAGDGWRVVTPRGEIRAGHVVLAGNVGMQAIYPKLARAILPVATYVVVTEKIGPRLNDVVRWKGAVTDTRRAGDYYRVVDGDRLLWGGKITTRRSVPPRLSEIMSATIANVFPELSSARIDWAWIGHMGYAVHKMPICREFAPGLISATALGGHGLNTAGAVAFATAGHILGTSDDIRLFAPYGALWGGGSIGRLGTQAVYWKLQLQDWIDERRGTKEA